MPEEINGGEDRIYLWKKGTDIIQRPDHLRFSIDSVLVADFAKIQRNTTRILDLGCGNGAIPLFLAKKTKAKITGIDIQAEACELARKNAAINGLSEQISVICDDMKNWRTHFPPRSFDHVISNPPFFPYNEHSLTKGGEALKIARHETKLALGELIGVASALLKDWGRFTLVHRAERLPEIFDFLRENRLAPKRLRICHARPSKDGRILLVEGVKCGKPGLTVLPPLILHGEGRLYSEEVQNMFAAPGDDDSPSVSNNNDLNGGKTMTLFKHKLHTKERESMIKISNLIREDVRQSGVTSGIALVYCPHTTSGILINENADPHVVMDLLYLSKKLFPEGDPKYLHAEGNSHAHAKAVLAGNSKAVVIEEGKLILGHWQDVFFCDFDGPRDREFFVKILEG
ncbi:MAG: secondary thiamine-phosphate synthase enzyme YjbQ [Fusobacteriaceae bacterium]|jgi:secondary thiamine-phosphate synthase enzyme|nr:secondary thiamine-phosphate synthase enzyme YjbQ [Fusobacteriaceae bacterium]